jgi:hypothetical protein
MHFGYFEALINNHGGKLFQYSWRRITAIVGASTILITGVTAPVIAAPGGDEGDRGDSQRATVNKSPYSHEVTRYGDTPSGNTTVKYNAKYGDAGAYRTNILQKADGDGYPHEYHDRDVVGSGKDKSTNSSHFANGITQDPF